MLKIIINFDFFYINCLNQILVSFNCFYLQAECIFRYYSEIGPEAFWLPSSFIKRRGGGGGGGGGGGEGGGGGGGGAIHLHFIFSSPALVEPL